MNPEEIMKRHMSTEQPDEPLDTGPWHELWMLEQDWMEIEIVLAGGDTSYTICGDPGDEFNHMVLAHAEWWCDRRAATDFEGPLPVTKLQAYDTIKRVVEKVIERKYPAVLRGES